MKYDVMYFPKTQVNSKSSSQCPGGRGGISEQNRGGKRAWLNRPASIYTSAPMAYNDLIQEVYDDFVSSCPLGNNSPFMKNVRQVLSAAIKDRKLPHADVFACYCFYILLGNSTVHSKKHKSYCGILYEQKSNTLCWQLFCFSVPKMCSSKPSESALMDWKFIKISWNNIPRWWQGSVSFSSFHLSMKL